jgi:hypothetical protein
MDLVVQWCDGVEEWLSNVRFIRQVLSSSPKAAEEEREKEKKETSTLAAFLSDNNDSKSAEEEEQFTLTTDDAIPCFAFCNQSLSPQSIPEREEFELSLSNIYGCEAEEAHSGNMSSLSSTANLCDIGVPADAIEEPLPSSKCNSNSAQNDLGDFLTSLQSLPDGYLGKLNEMRI